ncbi:hypothetical protein [Synechococcus phage DSL-LC03]|nr:hypothetical protein [Synechococcus phage DSL-LC03]
MSNIAILYSGQPRDFIECFDNHKEYLFNPNEDIKIDIFAHLWDFEDQELYDFIENKVCPAYIVMEKPKVFSHQEIQSDFRYYHPLNNIASQAYSLYQVSEIMNKYVQEADLTKYDYVVRTRTDNWFTEPLGKLSDYDPKGLHITDIKSHTDYALGDTFAFGDYDTMMAYCRMYPDFEAICSEGAIVNPECILGWNVKRNNLIVHKHPFYPKLYRDVR